MLIIENYLTFYTIDHESGTIYVIRFLYGKRDWMKILRTSHTRLH